MNDKRLRIYLDDHSALMVAEIELIGRCWWSNRNAPLGEFLQTLENEVKAQKSIVHDMIHRIGGKNTIESRLKKGAAWFAEKLGRLKLNDSQGSGQEYVEDCPVCCRANLIHVEIDEHGNVRAWAQLE